MTRCLRRHRDSSSPAIISRYAGEPEATHRDNLWTGVVRTTTASLQESVARLERSHPKVSDLDIFIGVQKEILWFEISVADVEAVAVIYPSDDLLEVS